MPLSTTFIILHYVCPSFGVILASATFSAPISSLKQALSVQELGDLNPMPWAFMTGNCLGWIAYSYITKDIFVLCANVPGLVISIWLNNGAIKLQYQAQCKKSHDSDSNSLGHTLMIASSNQENLPSTTEQDQESVSPLTSHEFWVLGIIVAWVIIFSFVSFLQLPTEKMKDVIGLSVNLNLIVFYGAPLSTILTVLRSRESNSIHRPTLAMTLCNTFFWLSYGFGIMDYAIAVPNSCGMLLGLIQLMLCLFFPRIDDNDENGAKNDVAELLTNENDNLEIL